ncbi:UNVERIFIED_CONTAM: hypothetical protein PYX00_010048 [Menopon gallinae]|uniref:Uncharacterized protein n=1 Tax=Menopon gallinae TaxID=328185 RepID=A0AAW2HEA6_9NEOP
MASVACIAVLALLAQANAFSIRCGENPPPVCVSSSPVVVPSRVSSIDLSGSQGRVAIEVSGSQGSSELPTFDLSGSGAAQSSERVDRKVYQVSLDNNGPSNINNAPVVRSQKQAPLITRPTITLPARIPGARTVSNKCKCVKTVIKPQIYEQLITVPVVQRYIQSTYRPVVEKIHYQAIPANSNDVEVSGGQSIDVQSLGVQSLGISVGSQAQSFVPVEVSGINAQVEAPTCQQSCPVQAVSFPSCY